MRGPPPRNPPPDLPAPGKGTLVFVVLLLTVVIGFFVFVGTQGPFI